jgi:hypothetical protein
VASFVPSKLAYLCVSNVISLLDYVVSSLVETLQNGCGGGHCVDWDITLPPGPNRRELCVWLQACVGFMFTACCGLKSMCFCLKQCFSTAGPRPGTGPWHQFYRAARICQFYFSNRFS